MPPGTFWGAGGPHRARPRLWVGTWDHERPGGLVCQHPRSPGAPCPCVPIIVPWGLCPSVPMSLQPCPSVFGSLHPCPDVPAPLWPRARCPCARCAVTWGHGATGPPGRWPRPPHGEQGVRGLGDISLTLYEQQGNGGTEKPPKGAPTAWGLPGDLPGALWGAKHPRDRGGYGTTATGWVSRPYRERHGPIGRAKRVCYGRAKPGGCRATGARHLPGANGAAAAPAPPVSGHPRVTP